MTFTENDNPKKDNELFDNGGWEHIDPTPPRTAEELLAEKRKREKAGIEFLGDYMR